MIFFPLKALTETLAQRLASLFMDTAALVIISQDNLITKTLLLMKYLFMQRTVSINTDEDINQNKCPFFIYTL